MAKEKKITIKHYLNKKLKGYPNRKRNFGKGAENTSNSNVEYPVYTQVIFNRQNNTFSSRWSINFWGLYGITQEEFTSLFIEKKDANFSKEIECKEKLIRDTIKYEINNYKEKFTLKGFGNRLPVYESGLIYVLNRFIISNVMNYLEDKITVKQYKELISIPYEDAVSDIEALMLNFDEHQFHIIYEKILSFLPSFFEELPDDLKLQVFAYIHFLHLENIREIIIRDNHIVLADGEHLISWLNGNLKPSFKTIIEKKLNERLKYAISDKSSIKNLDVKKLKKLLKRTIPAGQFFEEEYVEVIDNAVDSYLKFNIEEFSGLNNSSES